MKSIRFWFYYVKEADKLLKQYSDFGWRYKDVAFDGNIFEVAVYNPFDGDIWTFRDAVSELEGILIMGDDVQINALRVLNFYNILYSTSNIRADEVRAFL